MLTNHISHSGLIKNTQWLNMLKMVGVPSGLVLPSHHGTTIPLHLQT